MDMDIIVFEEATYWKMQRDLMKMFKEELIRAKREAEQKDEWLSWEDAKKIIGYKSKRQWQKLRDQGLIKYSQHERSIRYSKQSLLEFLEKHIK
jgi:hypothetical protein